MRIAVFIKSTTFNKGYGGLETQNEVLCEGLAARGHDVTVVSPPEHENVRESGVKYVFVPSIYRMLFASMDKSNWYNKSYEAFIKLHNEKPFDVVISQSSAGLGIIKRKNEIGIKVVGISHGTIGGEMRTLLNSAENALDVVRSVKSLTFGLVNYFGRQRQYIHGCNKVIAVSSAVKESIVNETFVPESKITVIHNGIDPATVPQKNWNVNNNERFKVLYVGRIEKSKGLRELLMVCEKLPKVFVNIVGDGPFLEELKALSRELKMSQRVLFYGRLPHEKAVEMYSCSDVFVLPTKRVEGFPMTLAEACFAGLPIVATDMGGNKDAVEDGFNGFLLENANTKSLENKIADLAYNRARAKEMGLNGRIKAQREFTLDRMIKAYEDITNCL